MPYIKRDPGGRITGISDRADSGYEEELDIENPDVQAYLELARSELTSSDVETIRVIEDLIDILIEKKLIVFTDLPRAAQIKLTKRQRMRGDLSVLGNLVVSEEDIL